MEDSGKVVGMERATRDQYIAQSNNPADPRKNVCALAVADFLGVADAAEYLHTADDLLNAIRSKYDVEWAGAEFSIRDTVGGTRKRQAKLPYDFLLVTVKEHVILTRGGATIVDTAPRKRDKRRLEGVWGITIRRTYM